jgi:hypothetical protein
MIRSLTRLQWWGLAVGAASAAFVVPLLGEYISVQPWGTILVLEIVPLLLLPACYGVLAALIIAVVHRQHRRAAFGWFALCVTSVALAVTGMRIGARIREDAFQRLAVRSAPLVAAVNSYQAKYGVPPAKLDDLVPEFMAEVPWTHFGAYPDYKYLPGPDAQEWGGNPWVLYVDCGKGGFNWDRFLYLPLQNYPEHGYGGSLQRIDSWAYVHE